MRGPARQSWTSKKRPAGRPCSPTCAACWQRRASAPYSPGLVLEGASTRCAPSGLTDPQLYIFSPAGTSIITTSGRTYLVHGDKYPADDPHGAAAAACRHAMAATPRRGANGQEA